MAAEPLRVRARRLAHGRHLPLPQAATAGSAGCDLRAAIATARTLAPGARDLVPTGLVLEIPRGWEAQVRPRSGLALRHGITVLNSPGTIDSDYRGEVGVVLINLGDQPFEVVPGARIAQLVFAPALPVRIEEADALDPSARSGGGFGSTGAG